MRTTMFQKTLTKIASLNDEQLTAASRCEGKTVVATRTRFAAKSELACRELERWAGSDEDYWQEVERLWYRSDLTNADPIRVSQILTSPRRGRELFSTEEDVLDQLPDEFWLWRGVVSFSFRYTKRELDLYQGAGFCHTINPALAWYFANEGDPIVSCNKKFERYPKMRATRVTKGDIVAVRWDDLRDSAEFWEFILSPSAWENESELFQVRGRDLIRSDGSVVELTPAMEELAGPSPDRLYWAYGRVS